MEPLQYLVLLGMVGYAIFRQTRVARVGDGNRFKLAIVYGAVGIASLVVTGWRPPEGVGWLFLAVGILLSVVVGVVRGILTRVWVAEDGSRLRQGTWLTVALFVAVIVVKIALGVTAGLLGVADGSSFAEILVIVAIMVAVQAEIVHRRALALPDGAGSAVADGIRPAVSP
ncbi:DUF1453 domain-containing protein [Agromyces sp. LHK192]|uniref:DUF1453 domain-containing protein n=1 Tax=Agromyces sp. LHK192 TaxID=2498704 RepID=UPI000FDB7BD0|nr:DUF1453 domain-containing protein [Agromyces sp. LHK192]